MRHRLALLVLAAAVLASVLVACGRGGEEVRSGTPGYQDEDAEVDTSSPFEMANPTTTDGATTVPGPAPTLPMPDVFRRTTTTQAGPSPTAAPPPTLAPIAVPAASTPTCDAFFKVATAGRDVQLRFLNDANADFESARQRLVLGFNEALNTLTPRLAEGPDPETAVALRDRILRMRTIAESAVTLEQAGGVFFPLQQPKEAGEAAGWPEILSHLTRYCVNVPRTFGVTE